MRFSERIGHRPVKTAIQIDSMDADLRAGLWNVFRRHFVEPMDIHKQYYMPARNRMKTIWDELFKLPDDDAPVRPERAIEKLKPFFLKGDYLEVYDLVDFTVQKFVQQKVGLEKTYNQVLEREVSGYRFVGGVLTPISNEYELQTIEEALAFGHKLAGAVEHLHTALRLLSDRESPDYRNSIKESISAVESAARTITGKTKASLGDLLPLLEKSDTIHPAQREAFSKLYGYTSDEQGIRHAMLENATVDFSDAKYMLAVCSAFIAYLGSKA